MPEALAAQRSGRVDDAIAIYDEVISETPTSFDAWHMRGVAHFQRFDFDAAERDIRHSLALSPAAPAARQNLSLVLQGRRLAMNEDALCREVISRYAPLVVDPPRSPLDGASAGMRVFVLDACHAGSALADALEEEAFSRGAAVTRVAVAAGRVIEGDIAVSLASSGARDVIACVGCTRPLGDWTLTARPAATSLIVDRARLAVFLERLRELSGQGRQRVRLACSDGAPSLPMSLPHVASRRS
jgi:hypothetical protein